jgi:hypothetical protein
MAAQTSDHAAGRVAIGVATRVRQGLLGTTIAGLASGPPAHRPILLPLQLAARAPWKPVVGIPKRLEEGALILRRRCAVSILANLPKCALRNSGESAADRCAHALDHLGLRRRVCRVIEIIEQSNQRAL